MAQIAQGQIKINLPINTVYSFIANLENMVYFWPKIKKVEKDPDSPDAVGPGTKYFIYSNTILGGRKKAVFELNDSTAHNHFEYRDSSGILTGFYFSEEPDGTMIQMYRKTEFGTLASLLTLNLVSSRDAKNEIEKALLRLKTFLEAENFTAPPEED